MSIFALVDGNNFFVSCHRAIQSDLEGLPVVVLSHDGGIIIARSNEAKALGIKMAEPVFKVKHIIESKKVICILSNHRLYKDTSASSILKCNSFCAIIGTETRDDSERNCHVKIQASEP